MQIVWIHGFPLDSRIFEPQRPLGGLMPDLPPRESMDDYARFVLNQFEGSAILAGLSMGGYICFAALRIAPERVGGLILIDTREVADTDEGRRQRFEMIEKVQRNGVKVVADSMLPKMLTARAPQELKDRVHAIMMSQSPEGVIVALKAMANRPSSADLLPNIRVPTLVIVGEEDPITPPADAERMARAIPDAKLVLIANAAHLSNYEQAAIFNEHVWSAATPVAAL